MISGACKWRELNVANETRKTNHMILNINLLNANTTLYRAGGASAILLFASYLAIIVVYVPVGAAPEDIEELLNYLAAHTIAWWNILGLSVLTDFLFIPISYALYIALKDVNRNMMITGIACLVSFVILDLAITWPSYAALIELSGKYSASTGVEERTSIVAAASYASSMINSGLLSIYIILIPGFGFLIIGLAMKNTTFNNVTAYLGMLSGFLGIGSVLGRYFSTEFGHISVILSSTLITFWVLLVGLRLFQLSSKPQA